ncbi:MAG TPA: hypothetical protein VGT41_01895 [Candidatus Babeliales bacterium]|nr:hypothetical protein [Candidatus Babeliales bacterium]
MQRLFFMIMVCVSVGSPSLSLCAREKMARAAGQAGGQLTVLEQARQESRQGAAVAALLPPAQKRKVVLSRKEMRRFNPEENLKVHLLKAEGKVHKKHGWKERLRDEMGEGY